MNAYGEVGVVGVAFVVVASLERLVIHSRSFLGAEDVRLALVIEAVSAD